MIININVSGVDLEVILHSKVTRQLNKLLFVHMMEK